MHSKNLLFVLLLSVSPITIASDDWDMIDDLDEILTAEDNKIQKDLKSTDINTRYNTVLKKARSLSFNQNNIIDFLTPLNEAQTKAILNIWIKRAVIANAEGTLSTNSIQSTVKTIESSYQNLRLIGDKPKKNGYIIIGQSVPSSLYFDYFNNATLTQLKKQLQGSFGEYYWDASIFGKLKRHISDTFENALIDMIRKNQQKK